MFRGPPNPQKGKHGFEVPFRRGGQKWAFSASAFGIALVHYRQGRMGVGGGETGRAPALREHVMLTIHEFNADAFARAAEYISRAFCLRRGTESRVAQTEGAVAQSRVLIANTDALLAINAMQLGWLWPAYRSALPAEEDR